MTNATDLAAYEGLYPMFGGYGTLELAFTRLRVLRLAATRAELWSAYTGPTAIRLLHTTPIDEVALKPALIRFGRVILGRRKLWVRERDLDTIADWRHPSAPLGGGTRR